MQLTLRDDLIFVSVELEHHAERLTVPDVLIDTGSAGTLFAADLVAAMGITPEPDDLLVQVYGVGGVESVFARRIEGLTVGTERVADFFIHIGGMDYGLTLGGILGMDFLLASGAVIDLAELELRFPKTAVDA